MVNTNSNNSDRDDSKMSVLLVEENKLNKLIAQGWLFSIHRDNNCTSVSITSPSGFVLMNVDNNPIVAIDKFIEKFNSFDEELIPTIEFESDHIDQADEIN